MKLCVCLQGGIYIVELIDKFTLAFPLLIVVLLEVIVICYFYGNTTRLCYLKRICKGELNKN